MRNVRRGLAMFDSRRVHRLALLGGIAAVTGTLGGAGLFMYSRPALVAPPFEHWYATVIVVLAGVYVHAMCRRYRFDLRASAGAMLVAFAVGIAVTVGAWVAPLWIYSYPGGARDVLLARFLQQALLNVSVNFIMLFMGGYLAAVSVDGYLDL